MTTKLMEWLRRQWKISNHAKYQHLFEEWIANILPSQIEGFEKQMYNLENHVLENNNRRLCNI